MAYTTHSAGSDPAARSAGFKFLIMMLAGFMLSIPILSIYLLNYDRQSRSQEARASIAEGWGGAQVVTGPHLVIPYRMRVSESIEENGKVVMRTRDSQDDLVILPERAVIKTDLKPERRARSIYEAVVYQANQSGEARYVLPADLADRDIPLGALMLDKAELRFGLSDVRGLQGGTPRASLDGKDLKLKPGKGANGTGFHAAVNVAAITGGAVTAKYGFGFRGNGELSFRPEGEDVDWTVVSPWPSPSFKGDFLPTTRTVTPKGFTANWKVGSLALGATPGAVETRSGISSSRMTEVARDGLAARVDLFEPVDIYDQIDRAAKFGFLFIGFTFVAFLMFDVIGGVRVSMIEYLLVGAGLVMFFVLLLAMAEVAGFATAYAFASAAIIGLITSYSAAVLKSWARAKWIGGMLVGLYAVLYVLLSLEAYSLLIGALLLFVALAGVMYLTRNVDWGAKKLEETVLP
jgi:inner membrane protein